MTGDVTRRNFLRSAGVGAAATALVTTDSARGHETGAKKKILGVCCSLRQGKTTATAVEVALQAACKVAPESIDTELIELAGRSIPAKLAVGEALNPGEVDDFPAIAEKLTDPAVLGIIVGTPVYLANMSSLCKVFLERCSAFRKQGFALSGKVAGVLAVGGVRNGGQELAIQSVQAALFCQEMLLVGDGRPTAHFGAALWNQGQAGIDEDEVGLSTAQNLGRHVAQVVLGRPRHS
jgi:multimeric flavodoxin WrbA